MCHMPYKEKTVQTLMRALHKSIQHTHACVKSGGGGGESSHKCVFSPQREDSHAAHDASLHAFDYR